MRSLPFPVRIAAGLVVSVADRAKKLPRQVAGLPITVASQMLQASMRLQQEITELAIKGDDALSGLQPVEENPSWATFDEDLELPDGVLPWDIAAGQEAEYECDPWAAEEHAIAEHETDSGNGVAPGALAPPDWLPDYDQLSLPQLRARLRQWDTAQLAELLRYEQATEDRAEFSGMLQRRIDKLTSEPDQSK